MNLTEIRKKNNLTQEQIAIHVGVTRQMISAIERGAKPSVEVAQKIADVLGFDWTLFFNEKEKVEA